MKLIKKNWVLLFVLLVALALRVYNLGFLSIWVDEYIHALKAKSLVTGIPFQAENNGILLTYSIYPFFKFFAINDFFARLPSVLYGVSSIYLLYLIAKRLYNIEIAYIASILLTISQYHIFWSRIARNYAIFVFMFLLLVYMFLKFFEHKEDLKGYFKKMGISGKFLLIFVICFGLSFISHPLTFFVVFSIGFYALGIFISRFFSKQKQLFLDKYSVTSYFFLIGVLLLFTPSMIDFTKSILVNFLPERSVEWIIPKWDRLDVLFETKKHDIFTLYYDVLKTDYSNLYVLGIIGVLISFIYNKKSALISFSFFVIPFLLMAYIYREPALPRYLIYIYPFFILYIAITIHFIYFTILKKLLSEKIIQSNFFKIVGLVVLLVLSPIKNSWNTVNSSKHGRVVPKELSHWYFTNWKDASKIKKTIMPNDIVITTGVPNMKYYLDDIIPIHYRQRYYNTSSHKYESIDTKNITIPHAHSFEGVKQIIENNDRVWLIVDYYFDGVFSDPQTKSYLINKMEYKPEYSNKDIKVFLYDKSKPKTRPNQILEVLNYTKSQTQEYFINVPQFSGNTPNLIIEAEGLNFTSELKVIVNKKNVIFVNHQSGNLFNSTKNSSLRQFFSVSIDRKWLVQGQNSLIFQYNTDIIKEELEGVTLYNIQLNP